MGSFILHLGWSIHILLKSVKINTNTNANATVDADSDADASAYIH